MGHIFCGHKAESAKLIMHFLKIPPPPPSWATPEEGFVDDPVHALLGWLSQAPRAIAVCAILKPTSRSPISPRGIGSLRTVSEATHTQCGVRNDAVSEFRRVKSATFCVPKVNRSVSDWRTLGGFDTKSQFWNTASNLESTIDPAFSRKKEIYYLYNLPFSKGQ